MAFSENWDILLCNCDEYEQDHVHCACNLCSGVAVSRATAFRHRTREFQSSLPLCATETDHEVSEASQNCRNDEDDSSLGDSMDWVSNEDLTGLSDISFPENRSDNLEESEILPIDPAHDVELEVKEKIINAILDALELQLELKLSNIGFDHILDWGKKIFLMGPNGEFEHLWPTCWKEAEKLLHSVGYRDAKKYLICLDESHRCHFSLLSSEDELCPHCSKRGSIPFYYLGLGPKVNLWASDPVFCKKMLSHWFQKDHWIERESEDGWGFELKKEIWDGNRFAELQWFWNPEEQWKLPAKCRSCKGVVSVEDIESSPDGNEGEKLVTCPYCKEVFTHKMEMASGDPRNLAYILHWDGFQPFDGKYNHGSGALEVQIANMCKEDRQKQCEIFVVGFVPTYLLPERRPVALDPFLLPLIEEIEDGFINGIEVDNYAFSLPQFPSGPAKLRHIVLLVTGDHVAICEMCKALFCGKNPCRRCKCGSTLIPASNHYYYGEYRKSTKYPWPKRNIDDELETLEAIEDEERKTVAQEMAKTAGFTGLSILHRLNVLYGFDYRRHCVFDVMHTIALGVVKKHLSFFLENDLLDRSTLQERLSHVPWTAEFLSSRYPSQFSRMGFWKAEEFQKFAYPISEVVLGGLLPDQHYEAWECLARIVEFLYCQGRNGWTVDSTAIFQDMVLRYNIMVEESQGLNACHVVNHNVTHIHEDVMNFGSPDNYWCYNFERAVKRYISISSNHKNIEITFARTELRREVLKVRSSLKSQEGFSETDICYPKERHYQSLPALESDLQNFTTGARHLSATCGILVGRLKPIHLSDASQINSICAHLTARFGTNHGGISEMAEECRSIFFTSPDKGGGMLYRLGENIVYTLPSNGQEKLFTLTELVRIKLNEKYHLFAIGDCLEHVMHGSDVGIHQWGKHALLRPAGVQITVPSSCIQRKVMLYPEPANLSDPSFFVCIDYQRPEFPVTNVIVPSYPEVGDMLLVKGDDPEPWRALALNVQQRNKVVQVQFYVPHPRWGRQSGCWVREGTRSQQVHFKSITGISSGTWRSGRSIYKED